MPSANFASITDKRVGLVVDLELAVNVEEFALRIAQAYNGHARMPRVTVREGTSFTYHPIKTYFLFETRGEDVLFTIGDERKPRSTYWVFPYLGRQENLRKLQEALSHEIRP